MYIIILGNYVLSDLECNNPPCRRILQLREKKNEERKDLVDILSATADTFNYFYLGERGGENCLEYFEEITDL